MEISVEGLSHSYGTKQGRKIALNNISFTLKPGFNVLLGPNGAGKSTLFSLLTSLHKVSQGNVQYNGMSVAKNRRQIMSAIGVVFQENTLDLDLTVEQNLTYFASLHGISNKQALLNINDVLTQLGLNHRLHEKVRSLNGGHKRRVEIARSLLHQPRFLLFDEPTIGLDIDSRHLILKFVRTYVEKHQCIALWATHLLEEVNPADMLLLLINGQLKGFNPCLQLQQENQVNTVAELFSKVTQKVEA